MKFLIEPWDHQRKTIEHVLQNCLNFFALFYEMGAGKTLTVINIYRGKCNQDKKLLKCLVIAPVVVLENWKKEFLSNSNLPNQVVHVLHGTGSKRIKLLKAQTDGVFITNTDALNMKEFWQAIEDFGFEFLIVDESHKFKNPASKRTKKMLKFAKQPQLKYRYILTGSPILNDALDIWSQYAILNPDIFDKNFFAFRSKYFYDANGKNPFIKFPKYVMKDAAYFKDIGQDKTQEQIFEELNAVIYKHAHRVTKDEALDLPEITYQTIEVSMSPAQARMYKEMKSSYVAFLEELKVAKSPIEGLGIPDEQDEKAMTADLAIVRLLRLQQLVSGIFMDETGEVIRFDNERNKVLQDLVESILADKARKNKIIIWCVFKESYKIIGELLESMKVKHVFLTGDQNYKEKNQAVEDFNTDPTIEVIVANQSAGGTGVNMQAGNYAVYYSRNFSLEADLQSEARNHRGGQTRKCTRIDLVCPNTIDEQVLEALKNKQSIADNVLKITP